MCDKMLGFRDLTPKKCISYALPLVLVPAVAIGGAVLFGKKSYSWISLCVAVISCLPFFIAFEKGRAKSTRLVLLAVLTALSVVGRTVFAPIPHFKPMTALVIITGIYLGAESGFLCGSIVLSNFVFGQGPWTPFQMFAWGTIGLFGGLLSVLLKRSRIALYVYGAFAGVLYSLILDVWTVVWYSEISGEGGVLTLLLASLPTMAIYAVSNVIFLMLLARPIGEKLERIKLKYGLDTP